MKIARVPLLAAVLLLSASPLFAGTKEQLIQLQTQVQSLQDQMARMQQSFDERMGVMKNLVEQSTDNINKMTTAVQNLQQAMTEQSQDNAAKVDTVSTQIQALNDSIDELKTRMSTVAKQLDTMANAASNLPAQAQNQAPPPQTLYDNALTDYNAGKYDIAMGEFQDYMKYYGTTDLAGNAQFYIGDINFRQGNYQGAMDSFDAVLQNWPGGNKAPAAQLKKGQALLKLGDKAGAAGTFKALIARYPKSPEAAQAREQLRRLAPSRASRRK
jgi:tol-pal system protein YbgF